VTLVTEAIPAHRDPAVVAATERSLDELSARCPTLIAAVLLTDDGFEVSRTAGERDGDDHRLASMGSTLQALGEAVARELRLGEASHVVVAGARGSMLVRRVGALPFALIGVFAALREEDIRTSQEIANRLAAALTS
jgi:predicted regulator of Ras-like GTPase activity (Roadblock/LC7/MglB family)